MANNTSDTIGSTAYIKAAEEQAKNIVAAGREDAVIIAALALWQRFASSTINDMQDEIAQMNMKIAEELLDHYKKYWPYEKAFVDEMFATAKPKENYLATANIFKGFASASMNTGRNLWLEYLESKCESADACMDARWRRIAGANDVDVINFGLRTEEAWTQAKVDRWYSRRKAALSLGRGVLEQMVKFQDAYASAGSSLGNFLGGTLNALGSAAAYVFKGPGLFNSAPQKALPSNVMPPVAVTKQAGADANYPAATYSQPAPVPYGNRIVK